MRKEGRERGREKRGRGGEARWMDTEGEVKKGRKEG